jgi:hypothetical protein
VNVGVGSMGDSESGPDPGAELGLHANVEAINHRVKNNLSLLFLVYIDEPPLIPNLN